MKHFAAFATSALLLTTLSACSIEEVAATAADAAACKALSSTLDGIGDAYREGLIDSGVLQQVDDMVGQQVDDLLSTGLAQDLNGLLSALAESESAAGAQERVDEFLGSITERCATVGVDLAN